MQFYNDSILNMAQMIAIVNSPPYFDKNKYLNEIYH